MSNKVCVVIPVHSSTPSQGELSSFRQCFNMLGKYPVKIVAPEGLSLNAYKKEIDSFEIIYIDPDWQASIEGYNRLKQSLFFYNLFRDYEFLLTYELDAWVFKDELDIWVAQNYDYIGAPWFKDEHTPGIISGVGNSGFSLRKISACIRLLSRIDHINKFRKAWYGLRLQSFWRFQHMVRLFKKNLKIRTTENIHRLFIHWNEDTFFAEIIPELFTDFNVAPKEAAVKFSFEVNPRQLFEQNNQQLPFGCHAWEKYEPAFWRQYILP